MDDISNHEHAVELLQQLGLTEYEARCFTVLSRRDRGTAKEISESSEVPRTRVYDAVRVLESKGLVETQHTNPQVFRAVSVAEATDILRSEYEQRISALGETLEALAPVQTEPVDVTHEVWALADATAIARRTRQLVADADSEILFVVGDAAVLDEGLTARLRDARDAGVMVAVSAGTPTIREQIQPRLPTQEVAVSNLAWLTPANGPDTTRISRLLLVDNEMILVSSIGADDDHRAVFGRGFDNGLVAIVRRLMTAGPSDGDAAPAADGN
jgi:sugar-specific transcriptional regulator TrmB